MNQKMISFHMTSVVYDNNNNDNNYYYYYEYTNKQTYQKNILKT